MAGTPAGKGAVARQPAPLVHVMQIRPHVVAVRPADSLRRGPAHAEVSACAHLHARSRQGSLVSRNTRIVLHNPPHRQPPTTAAADHRRGVSRGPATAARRRRGLLQPGFPPPPPPPRPWVAPPWCLHSCSIGVFQPCTVVSAFPLPWRFFCHSTSPRIRIPFLSAPRPRLECPSSRRSTPSSGVTTHNPPSHRPPLCSLVLPCAPLCSLATLPCVFPQTPSN